MSAVEELLREIEAEDPFDQKSSQWDRQLAAMNERFNDARDRISVLDRLANESGIDRIEELSDVVPLLFSHTTYKSYPEGLVRRGQWEILGKWLSTLSTLPSLEDIEFSSVTNLDDWIQRLHMNKHYVYSSSGTTGKSSLMDQGDHDLALLRRIRLATLAWSTGIDTARKYPVFFTLPPQPGFLVQHTYDIFAEAIGRPGSIHWLTDRPLLVSEINGIGSMRLKIASGEALPSDVADFERESKRRSEQNAMDLERLAELIMGHTSEPIVIFGYWAQHWSLTRILQSKGFTGLHPQSVVFTGGGLKGLAVPDDYKEQIASVYQVGKDQYYTQYGCTEIISHMVGCEVDSYHVPPWVIPIVLTKSGEAPAAVDGDAVRGRMAFVDLSVSGRWGGVITGDQVVLHLGRCPCGRNTPSVTDVVRYVDLAGGDDKLTCAGTLESYVRTEIGI